MAELSGLAHEDQQAIGKTLVTLLKDYLWGLFADDNFNRGEYEGPPETSFRLLTPEVVLVSAHLRINSQGLVGGGKLDRGNFSLRALQRQADGSWLIVSEMFQETKPKPHTRTEEAP